MMKIEAGKSYRDEHKTIWDVLGRDSGVLEFPWRLVNVFGHIRLFADNGTAPSGSWLVEDVHELAETAQPDTAPAHTGPVVVETVKRIVEGVYGLVRVDVHRSVRVFYIDPEDGYQATPEQLRAAAATLTEIADALDEGAR